MAQGSFTSLGSSSVVAASIHHRIVNLACMIIRGVANRQLGKSALVILT